MTRLSTEHRVLLDAASGVLEDLRGFRARLRPGRIAYMQHGKGSFAVWWRGCLEAAGIRYRNPHTARHTFATRWLRRGGRLETLSLVMGHASIGTTHDLYAHLDTSDILIDVALIDSLT